jgi:hypothetical protein
VHPGAQDLGAQAGPDAWITEIRTYLKDNILPDDMTSADRIAHLAKRYTLVEGDLYRRGANGVLMRCITREEGCELLAEVHGGECGNYASLRTLVGKAFRYEFYWPTTLQDAVKLVKTCKACQFRDRGHDYLGPRDLCCAVTAHEELRRVAVPRASQRPRESWVTTYQPCCTTASESQHINTQKGCAGKGCWPHPRVRSLSRGGPEGHCRYPEDRIPPAYKHQVKTTASASRLGVAPRPPCVPVAPPPTPGSGQHRSHHMPPQLGVALGPPCVTWAPAPTFWRRAALELPRVTWALWAASK